MITPKEVELIRQESDVELCLAEAARCELAVDRQLVLLLGTHSVEREIGLMLPRIKVDKKIVLLLLRGRYAEAGWNVDIRGDRIIFN
jgi:hypothetical protein